MSRPQKVYNLASGTTVELDGGLRLHCVESGKVSSYTLHYYLNDILPGDNHYLSASNGAVRVIYVVSAPVEEEWVRDELVKRASDYSTFTRALSALPKTHLQQTLRAHRSITHVVEVTPDFLLELNSMGLSGEEKFFALEADLLDRGLNGDDIRNFLKRFRGRLNSLSLGGAFNGYEEVSQVRETMFQADNLYHTSPQLVYGLLSNFPQLFLGENTPKLPLMLALNDGKSMMKALRLSNWEHVLEFFYSYRSLNSLLNFIHRRKLCEGGNALVEVIDGYFGEGFVKSHESLGFDFFTLETMGLFNSMMDEIVLWSELLSHEGDQQVGKAFFNVWLKVRDTFLIDALYSDCIAELCTISKHYELFSLMRDFALTNSIIDYMGNDVVKKFTYDYVHRAASLYGVLEGDDSRREEFSEDFLGYLSDREGGSKNRNLASKVFQYEFIAAFDLANGDYDGNRRSSVKSLLGVIATHVRRLYGPNYRGNPCMELVFYLLRDFDVKDRLAFLNFLRDHSYSFQTVHGEALGDVFIESLIEVSGNSGMPMEWAIQLVDTLNEVSQRGRHHSPFYNAF